MKKCTKCSHIFDTQEWKCPHCEYQPNIIDGYISFAPKLAESSPGFDKSYFDILAHLESKNFWFRARNRLIIYIIKCYFTSAKNLLEIGCGTGFVLSGIEREIPHLNIFGSEIFVHGLSFAQQRLSQCQLFQMDAQVIPFNNEFDLIGAFDVLEHIKDDQLVLNEMYQALSDNGGIVLTVPQHPWLWSKADEYAHHVRRYSSKELIKKVKQSGFKVVRVTSFVSLLLPLMFLSRFLNNGKDYDLIKELSISPFLNKILEKILNIERSLIKSGFNFTFGGSLFLIAKKK